MMMMGLEGGGFAFSLGCIFTTWFAATIITQLSLVAFIGSLKREIYIWRLFLLGGGRGERGASQNGV